MDLWVREARLFKYGSGTGTNFSSLRAAGEKLSGGGKSSGLMGFLKIGDRAAGAIKSGGTTRRAAKMVIVDADHPDIQEYINWKVKEEQKVASIVAGSKMHEKQLNAIFSAIRTWDGTEADGRQTAKDYLADSGSDLSNTNVTITLSPTEVTVTVSGDVMTLVPGMTKRVSATATVPRERFAQ